MRKISLLFVVCLFSGLTVFAQEKPQITQGSLYAVSKKGAELGACPLKNTRVSAGISGFITRVKVVQEFENNFNEPIEAVYTFPLSDTAAVDDMTMRIGDRIIRSFILKKEEARKVYETAKEEGKTASLLDQERPNIFTQSVANIAPNEKIQIEISYVETLKFEEGSYEFVFPMTVAPRYIPNSVSEEDAEKISPPVAASETRDGHDISIEVNLNAGVPVENIVSNSHKIQSLNLGSNSAKISLMDAATIPNKDFVLRYDVIGKRMEDAVLSNYGKNGGFFSLILSPPERLSAEDIMPKEIVFVLDTSGSMEGFPIEKAKESMRLALDNLYPDDTFNLITFAGDTHILFDKPVPATKANLERAQDFLASREGDGGTEMMKAVKAALEPSDAQDHLRIVCFMTDGEVGDDFEIISEVKKHKNVRVFSFGIGDSVNRFLLDQIAKEGRGEAEYVLLEDDGSRAARRFHERIRNPYLTDISIEWNGLPVSEIYPKRIPDLFGAKPVVVFGRYNKAANGTVKLKGKVGGQIFEREIAVNLPAAETESSVIATLWARTKVDDLMSQSYKYDSDEDEAVLDVKNKTKNEIVKLGLDYRLLTQFTSFVAVEERISANGKSRKIRVPIYNSEESTVGDKKIRPSSAYSINTPANVQSITVVTKSGAGRGTGVGNGTGSGFGNGTGNGTGSTSVVSKDFELKQPISATLGSRISPTKPISAGVVNGRVESLPKPEFPSAAKAVSANGAVNVQITIDETGRVIFAKAVSGHPLLRQAAEQAALNAKFTPTLISGKPAAVTGLIVYNFQNPDKVTPDINSSLNEIREQTEEDKAETAEFLTEKKRRENLAEKLHIWLFNLIEKSENISSGNENLNKFISDGKAKVQIVFVERTPDSLEKLKKAGFEIVSAKSQKKIFGKIEISKIEKLTEIGEIKYILPNIH